jgi:SAM-dependent methyltransferase
VALASHVIKHLDDERLAVAFGEVARVLRPGGRFLLWEFKLSRFSAPLFWTARRTGVPPSFTLRSASTLRAALLAAGFKRAEQVRTGFFLVPPVPRIAVLAQR